MSRGFAGVSLAGREDLAATKVNSQNKYWGWGVFEVRCSADSRSGIPSVLLNCCNQKLSGLISDGKRLSSLKILLFRIPNSASAVS